MLFFCEHLPLETTAPIQIIDITDRVRKVFDRYRVRNGQVTVCSAHTTAFIAVNESEPMLQQDMLDFLTRLVPVDAPYRHNINPVDGRLNAHAHLIGLFMNASETVPVVNGELLLGSWQSIFFIELDGPRAERTLRVQIIGES